MLLATACPGSKSSRARPANSAARKGGDIWLVVSMVGVRAQARVSAGHNGGKHGLERRAAGAGNDVVERLSGGAWGGSVGGIRARGGGATAPVTKERIGRRAPMAPST